MEQVFFDTWEKSTIILPPLLILCQIAVLLAFSSQPLLILTFILKTNVSEVALCHLRQCNSRGKCYLFLTKPLPKMVNGLRSQRFSIQPLKASGTAYPKVLSQRVKQPLFHHQVKGHVDEPLQAITNLSVYDITSGVCPHGTHQACPLSCTMDRSTPAHQLSQSNPISSFQPVGDLHLWCHKWDMFWKGHWKSKIGPFEHDIRSQGCDVHHDL